MLLPPPLSPSLFRALETDRVADAAARFAPVVSALQEFLNAMPPLDALQHLRRRGRRPAFRRRARVSRGHWWFSHEGGRNEGQWNVGMFPCHLRFGIGFNATRGGWGKPELVEAARAAFLQRLRAWEGDDPGLCARAGLEAEVYDRARGLRVLPVSALHAEAEAGAAAEWLFVGRLLRSGPTGRGEPHPGCEDGDDSAVLADPARLAEELRRAAGVLWPVWEESRLTLVWA
jgi:hypothetical protein